jgi:outer membrane murein-binding lipoprotein Lpp
MNKKLLVFVLVIFAIGLMASYMTGRVTAASTQQKGSGDSVQELNRRVSNLEGQVAALQKKIKELDSRGFSRFLTVPGTQAFPGNQIPPGAKQHEVSGLKYWTIPLKEGQ